MSERKLMSLDDMFGDSEAEETEITSDGIEETPKKEGFLKKLSRILFGEDDEDEKGSDYIFRNNMLVFIFKRNCKRSILEYE